MLEICEIILQQQVKEWEPTDNRLEPTDYREVGDVVETEEEMTD